MEAKNISGMLVTYLSSEFLLHSSCSRGGKMNQAFKTSQATHQTRRWLNLPQKSQQLIDGSPLIYQMYISRSSSGGYENEKCAMLSAQLVDLKVEPAWVTSIDLPMQICFPLGASEAADKSRIILSSIRLPFPSQEHWNDKPWSSHNFLKQGRFSQTADEDKLSTDKSNLGSHDSSLLKTTQWSEN